jgi:hypothetical protein
MKLIFLTVTAALLLSACSTGGPPTRDMAEPRDSTSPGGTITDDHFLR